MSHLQYYSYKGFGETAREQSSYSQTVRVGDRIECSGQGGWVPETGKVHTDLKMEIDQAFANVELALKDAGGKGWSQVFRVTIYLVDMTEDSLVPTVESVKKWMPNHKPILTLLGVKQLALEGMRIEVEAIAHDEERAKPTEKID